MIKQYKRNEIRKAKHRRILYKIRGTAEKPRLSIYKSNNHTYLQLVDDINNKVLLAVNSLQKDVKAKIKKPGTKEGDRILGEIAAKKFSELGIKEIVFDRSGYKYHGRIREIAEGARSTKLLTF